MNLDDALQTFIAESRELLEEMQSALLSLGAPGVSMACDEAVNAVFRAAHTIKGSAGLFGLDDIVAFTHVAESLLDEVRAGAVPIDEALVALLLACADHLRALVDAVAAGTGTADEGLAGAAVPLLVRLRVYLADDTPAQTAAATALGGGTEGHWHLSLRFGAGVLRNGLDPLSFLRYLGRIGRIAAIVTLPDTLPPLDAIDPECCHLGFELALLTSADKATIESVFEFVLDDCALRIVPPRSRIDEFVALIEALPESPARLGEILVQCGSVTARELERALQAQPAGVPQRLGEILVEQSGVAAPVVDAALGKQQHARAGADRASVRVDAAKLDRLVDLVGELIVVSAGTAAHARRSRDAELVEACSVLSGLVEEVRDSALELRMVKIGATFGRFKRVVHDVAHDLGKEIDLVVSGEDTELDKTVVEKIADPLTHLVRNAIDHGIEPAAQRAERGKPARGTLRLNAYHDSGSIVIEVGDDGGGLNRERILAKAIERGLVEPAHKLSDAEVYALVFEPGFSTAEQVTNLSGRGVGMDVVKRNISALRGSVAIDSQAGRGTTITVRLPLTLAIINGFQVGAGRSVFVLPLELVDECIAFSAAPGHEVTNLRGRVLPFVRLRTLFGIHAPPPARENIVVVRWGGQRFGLVVDTLLGESQTVIKPLSPMFAGAQGISGSGIRGSGEIALILDVPALFERLTQSAAAHPSTSVTENLPC